MAIRRTYCAKATPLGGMYGHWRDWEGSAAGCQAIDETRSDETRSKVYGSPGRRHRLSSFPVAGACGRGGDADAVERLRRDQLLALRLRTRSEEPARGFGSRQPRPDRRHQACTGARGGAVAPPGAGSGSGVRAWGNRGRPGAGVRGVRRVPAGGRERRRGDPGGAVHQALLWRDPERQCRPLLRRRRPALQPLPSPRLLRHRALGGGNLDDPRLVARNRDRGFGPGSALALAPAGDQRTRRHRFQLPEVGRRGASAAFRAGQGRRARHRRPGRFRAGPGSADRALPVSRRQRRQPPQAGHEGDLRSRHHLRHPRPLHRQSSARPRPLPLRQARERRRGQRPQPHPFQQSRRAAQSRGQRRERPLPRGGLRHPALAGHPARGAARPVRSLRRLRHHGRGAGRVFRQSPVRPAGLHPGPQLRPGRQARPQGRLRHAPARGGALQ